MRRVEFLTGNRKQDQEWRAKNLSTRLQYQAFDNGNIIVGEKIDNNKWGTIFGTWNEKTGQGKITTIWEWGYRAPDLNGVRHYASVNGWKKAANVILGITII